MLTSSAFELSQIDQLLLLGKVSPSQAIPSRQRLVRQSRRSYIHKCLTSCFEFLISMLAPASRSTSHTLVCPSLAAYMSAVQLDLSF